MMKTLKQLIKDVEKALGETPKPKLYSYDRNDWINKAMDEWHRICTICHKTFKNYRGVIIHTSKSHREIYKLAKLQRLIMLTPSDGKIHAYWNNHSEEIPTH